jgi:hypothetical protein
VGTPDDPVPTLDQIENLHDALTARTRSTTMETNELYCTVLYCIINKATAHMLVKT